MLLTSFAARGASGGQRQHGIGCRCICMFFVLMLGHSSTSRTSGCSAGWSGTGVFVVSLLQ